MDYHCFRECENHQVVCETCDLACYPFTQSSYQLRSLQGHDCAEVLKQNADKLNEQSALPQSHTVVCKNGCSMT